MKILKITNLLFVLTLTAFGSLYAQNAIKGEWSNVKIGGGGFVSGVIACPTEQNLFYARTDVGGAYRWNDTNQKWLPLLDWVSEDEKALLGVESIAIDPNSPNRLYIAAGLSGYSWPGQSILISDDYGETFEKVSVNLYIHGNGMGRQTGEKLMVDPNKGNILFYGTRKNGLWKSTDSAATWTQIESFPVTSTPNLNGVSFLVFDKNSAELGEATQTIYAGCSQTGENMYVSKDGGANWEAIPDTPTTGNIMPHRAVLSSDGSMLYVTYANGAGPHLQTWDGVNELMDKGAVFSYNTVSGEWKNISPIDLLIEPNTVGCYGGISIDPNNNNRLVCSTINHWSQQQVYTDGSSAWGDRVFVSEDGGENWQNIFEGDNPTKLDNNGVNWISGHNLHWVGSAELDPFNSERLFLTSGNGIFMIDSLTTAESPTLKFSVDGIEETVPYDMVSIPNGPFVSIVADYDGWVHQDVYEYPAGARHAPNMGSSTGLAYSPQNTEVLVRAGSSNGSLYYSLDQGANWTVFESLPGEFTSGRVAVSSDGETHVVVWIPGYEGGATVINKMYATTDWGASWSNFWNSSYGSISGGHPYTDPIEPRTFYIYSSAKGKIFKFYYPNQGQPQVTELASIGTSGSAHLAVNQDTTADFWVALNAGGLSHYKNGGTTTIDNINAQAVSLGKAATDSDYPTLFVWGVRNEIEGMYRSTDKGESWFRINDDAHEYGGLGNTSMILGDNNVFGKVYMSTAGRGFAFAESGTDTLSVDEDVVQNPDDEDPDDEDVTAIGDEISEDGMFTYPNPFTDYFQIENVKQGVAKVYTSQGKLIQEITFSNSIKLGTNWPKGVYLIKVYADNSWQLAKLIKY
ncbi:T9SS type A sorting domain-containing protein [Chondrinema litorale]|uniref:T9SS type A sorting domain-containing protein n=1 Tax=Chondrinema litorale TaxID=2994555 RepID=UPI00254336C5|nr:T9SS type A sorting domain-containing protein [Chondrinema litorale]UZR99299.1 T9SS type A sorting domain-containing protein [Chondrinema litorale]